MFKRLTTTLKLVHLKYNCQLQGFHIGEVFLHWYFSRILTILIFKASYQLICWVDLFLLIPGRFYFCLFLLKKNHFLKNNYFMCKIFKYFLQFFSKCIISSVFVKDIKSVNKSEFHLVETYFRQKSLTKLFGKN